VNVPVKLYTATTSRSVKFNQINSKTGARIKQKRVDAGTGQEVEYEDIVKGYELSPGRYVTLTEEELGSVAPQQTKSIGLELFVPVDEINILAYNGNSYYVAPADLSAGHAYRLLRDAMGSQARAGIGRVILRSKEHLAALRVQDGVLVLATICLADEINKPGNAVSPADLGSREPSAAEAQMAVKLVDSMTVDFDHEFFQDHYRNEVLEMIERKAAGEVIEVAPEEEPAAASPPDLMATLAASLAAVEEEEEPAAKPARKPAVKKPAAKPRKKAAA
jgi:DNA end-binding protein Ku